MPSYELLWQADVLYWSSGPRVQRDCNLASLKRRAWAQSRDSLWQESEQEQSDPQDPQQSKKDGDTQTHPEEPG